MLSSISKLTMSLDSPLILRVFRITRATVFLQCVRLTNGTFPWAEPATQECGMAQFSSPSCRVDGCKMKSTWLQVFSATQFASVLYSLLLVVCYALSGSILRYSLWSSFHVCFVKFRSDLRACWSCSSVLDHDLNCLKTILSLRLREASVRAVVCLQYQFRLLLSFLREFWAPVNRYSDCRCPGQVLWLVRLSEGALEKFCTTLSLSFSM